MDLELVIAGLLGGSLFGLLCLVFWLMISMEEHECKEEEMSERERDDVR